jgi:hypothetical protein
MSGAVPGNNGPFIYDNVMRHFAATKEEFPANPSHVVRK